MNNTMENKRCGTGIGIITRGTASIKWMQHMYKITKMFPIGMFWELLVVEGDKGWAENRNEVVRKARERNYEYLFFIDDDVFVSDDALQRMLSSGKDIVTGIYWTKTDNSVPVIFEKIGAGPMFNFPIDKLFEVDGSGLGCCLINMKVFDDFDKAGIPYFKENWIMKLDNGMNITCPIGEDHYFFYHAKKLGYKVWADSGILCDHYDVNTKRFFPSAEKVRELTGRKLEEIGRADIVEEHNKKLGLDKNKPTVAFINYTANPFSGNELERRGVGGAETAIINLAKNMSLTRKFNVHVFTNCPNPGVYDGVVYHEVNTGMNTLKALNADLLIVSRNSELISMANFKKDYNVKKLVLWCHDLAEDPAFTKFKEAYDLVDKVVLLSEFHKKNVKAVFPFVDDSKIVILGNGVDTSLFKEKIDKVSGRLIYSSTPFRGLDILADVFPEIRKRVPHATLKVFSSMKVYGNYKDDEFKHIYDALKTMEGVEYTGTIKQSVLAKEMQKAELLVYPNSFRETFCITVAEAQTAGTPVVTTDLGALSELVTSETGVTLRGNPYSKEYKEAFINAVVELLTNKSVLNSMSTACLNKDFDWKKIADKWLSTFFKDVDSIQQVGNVNTPEYWNTVYKYEIDNMLQNRTTNEARKKEQLKYIKDGDKVLDVGCGTGDWTRDIRANNPNSEIWGTDFSLTAIDYCRQKDRTIFYANHPLLNDDFDKNYFDVITINHVLEHLDKPEEMIAKAKSLLKKGGKLIVTIPINDDDWHEHIKIWHLNDIEELLRPFKCNYDVKMFYDTQRRYKDGRYFQEAMVVIDFIGE